MKKRLVCFLMACVFVVGLAPFCAFATETVASGYCGGEGDGKNIEWVLYSDGLLKISGSGKMNDYDYGDIRWADKCPPWEENWWYPSVQAISIESGVTNIGNGAFYASHIEQISIPSSVIEIGSGAFRDCNELRSITLPDSVTSFGDVVFADCSKLERIEMQSTVTHIGYGAFWECTSLKSISIPPNLADTSIDGWFGYCSELTSIQIPPSLSPGEWAFAGCTKLSSIRIPTGVTTIGQSAFEGCTALSMVVIPNSVTVIDSHAFESCDSLTDVYYSGTETQWNNIWMPWNDTLKNANIHFNSSGPALLDYISVEEGKYCIHIIDENGNSLKGAQVSWTNNGTSQTQTTQEDGMVLFGLTTIGTPVIQAELDGYTTWTNENSNWKKSENRYEKIILYSGEAAKYKLKSARYSNSSSMSNSTDLLTRTKKLNLKNDGNLIGDLDFGIFYLSCAASETTGITRYELWQKDTKIKESTDGSFGQLSVTSFSKGGGCFIRVVTSDGKQVDTNINLEFAENNVNLQTTVSLGKGAFQFKVADNVPFFGGSTVDITMPINLPVKVTANESTIRFEFNTKDTSDDFDKTTKQLDALRSFMSDARNLNLRSALAYENLAILGGEESEFALPGGKFKAHVVGYAETNIGSEVAKGNLYILIEAQTKTFGFNTIVGVVPVTVQVSAGLKSKIGGSFQYASKTDQFDGSIDFNATLFVKAFGGAGIGKVVGVGAYGNADLEFDAGIGTITGLRKVDLTGELGLKAYLALFTYTRPFAHNTWHLYTANTVGTMSLMGGTEPWTAGLYDASQYEPADLSYLSQESGWQGGGGLQLMEAGASTQLTPLLTDTYRNARPVMISAGDALYAAFVRADQDSGDRYVVCTKYDGSSWCEPVRMDDTAVLDDSPALCADGSGNVWLAYARTTDGWTDKNSLSDYATNQEIVVGKLDPTALTLTDTKTYAAETGYVHSQTLSVVDGQPVLAWADTAVTDDNSVLTPASGSIRYAVRSGGTWGDAVTLTSAAPDQLAVGKYNSQTAVAYTKDRTLSCVTVDGTVSTLAEDVTGRVTFGTLPGADSPAFLWNENNVLVSSDETTVEAEGITKEYAIVGNNVYYSSAADNSANLVVVQYHGADGWGLPIWLTGDARYLENLSAASLNGQDYVFGMSTGVTITEETVEDAKNLVWSGVMPVSDLRLEDAFYDVDSAAAGESIPVTLTVTNAGDHSVSSFDILVNDSEVRPQSCALAPGESVDVDIPITCPSAITEYTIKVIETGEDDYHPDDNVLPVSMGYPDAVVDLEYHQIGTQKSFVATVVNEGVSNASGSLLFYDNNGDVVAVSTFEDLAPGDVAVAQYEFDAEAANIIDGDVSVMAVVDQEEYYTFNNEASLFISKPYQPTEIKTVTVSGGKVTAQVFCNEEDAGATVCCAFYKESGQMIRTETDSLTADQLNELTYALPDGTKTVKWFVMDGEGRPVCESAEQACAEPGA